jgi:hypothetical protein
MKTPEVAVATTMFADLDHGLLPVFLHTRRRCLPTRPKDVGHHPRRERTTLIAQDALEQAASHVRQLQLAA